MSAKPKLSLIGAGRMGTHHALTLSRLPSAELVCISDLHFDTARALAERCGTRAVDDPDAAIEDPQVNGVVIASSTASHADLVTKAARAGKAIFCEKPIDLDLPRVKDCLRAVEQAGVSLQMGFNRRFDPSLMTLRRRVVDDFSAIDCLRITSRDPAAPGPEYLKVSGGLFRDMMIHDFDTARWLLGEEPIVIHAMASCRVDPAIGALGDVDTAMVSMRTASGALCCIDNSRRAVYGYDQRVEVLGPEGMVQVENPPTTNVVQSAVDGRRGARLKDFAFDRYHEAFEAEMDHFSRVAAGVEGPKVTGEDGWAALALAEAAEKSWKTAVPVRLDHG